MSIADTHGHHYDDEHLPFEENEVRDHLDAAIRLWREKRAEAESAQHSAEFVMAEHYIDAYQSMRVSLFGEPLPADVVSVQRVLDIRVYRNGAKVAEGRNVLIDNLGQEVEFPWYEGGEAQYSLRITIKP